MDISIHNTHRIVATNMSLHICYDFILNGPHYTRLGSTC